MSTAPDSGPAGRQHESSPRHKRNGWRDFGHSLEPFRRNPVWRAHCDALHRAWVRECLAGGSAGIALKTDLFEEAVGEGVCGVCEELGWHSYGIDMSLSVAAEAMRRGRAAAVCADIRALPFAEASLDTAVSISTLDHFRSEEDIRLSLIEIRRALRPGGRLLITLDNPRNPVVALRNALPQRVRRGTRLVPYFVGKTLSLAALCRLLGSCGYKVEQHTTLMHCPRVLAIPLARACGSGGLTARVLGAVLRRFEYLRHLPTAELTGHFVAVRAVRSA